ncbi:MAG: hypothetical protein HPY55_00195 [Firmicutes bacterium]|nr:hypothetical protein [Bacillota bacterium]
MKSRSWPLVVIVVVLLSTVASIALIVTDALPAGHGGSPVRPWDIRGMVREAIQDMLRSDETRLMLESMMPETVLDRQALVKQMIDAISTSEEARKALRDALYTPEAREAFAAALKSPEAERAIRELLSSPGMRKMVADLVRESMRQGY